MGAEGDQGGEKGVKQPGRRVGHRGNRVRSAGWRRKGLLAGFRSGSAVAVELCPVPLQPGAAGGDVRVQAVDQRPEWGAVVHFLQMRHLMGDDVVERRLRSENQPPREVERSEEHTSELQSLMRISYAVFCLKKKKNNTSK